MATLQQSPANAPFAEKALTWADNRFPASSQNKEHLGVLRIQKNLNFGTYLGALAFGFGDLRSPRASSTTSQMLPWRRRSSAIMRT
jgi:hypothetical protein